MGLDMYLYRKTYVKNWNHTKPESRNEITIKINRIVRLDIKTEGISYIVEEVAYWRKANHIHKWFVDNVQNGKDECEETYVSREKLIALLEACQTAIEEPSKKEQVLPTKSGFFFGSTEYDEYYLGHTKDTIKILTALLAEENDGDFYYRSSW